MNIYLIRHGQTDWNNNGKIQGNIDTELNEIGICQAQFTGKKLIDCKIEQIYCSNLKRAVQTAQIINNFIKVPSIIIPELREISYGDWEGRIWEDLHKENTDFIKRWLHDRTNIPAPGGESFQAVKNRLQDFVTKLPNKPFESIAIVTHAGIIKTLICMFLAIDLNIQASFLFHNGSISTVTHEASQGFTIINLNVTTHLKME